MQNQLSDLKLQHIALNIWQGNRFLPLEFYLFHCLTENDKENSVNPFYLGLLLLEITAVSEMAMMVHTMVDRYIELTPPKFRTCKLKLHATPSSKLSSALLGKMLQHVCNTHTSIPTRQSSFQDKLSTQVGFRAVGKVIFETGSESQH